MIEDTSTNDKILTSCYDWYENGYLSELENHFTAIPQDVLFEGINKVKHDIIQAYLLSIKGEYSSAEKIASIALQKSNESGLILYAVDAYLVLMETYERTEKFDNLAESIEKVESLLDKFDNKNDSHFLHRKIWLFYFKGRIQWWRGNNITAQQYFEENLEIAKRINNKFDIAISSRNVALVIDKLNKQKSKNLQLEAIQIFREINHPAQLAWSLMNYGAFISGNRNYEQALTFYLESLEIREKIGNKNQIFWSLNNIGGNYASLDKLDKALEYFEKCYKIAKELGNNSLILMTYHNRISTYIDYGDLEKTEYYFKEYIELPKNINERVQPLWVTYFKAHIYRMKGQIQEVLDCSNQIIRMVEENENFRNIEALVVGYVYKITFLLELKELKQANENLQRIKYHLDKITDEIMHSIIEQYYKLGEALILKNSLRMKEKVKAQEFFESCIEDKDFTSTSWQKNLSMINLCDLYLEELSTYGDNRTLSDLTDLLTKMKMNSSNNYYLMIKTIIIQAKLALVDGKIQKAEELFTDALSNAREKNLTVLENEIKEEQNQINDWYKFSNNESTFLERLQKAQISNYVKEAEKYIGIGKMGF